MVSHCDCKKQHDLSQFILLNVKPCTEGTPNIQHAKVRARAFVRAKGRRVEAFICDAYAKKEGKNCFQCSVKYRRVDRTVWNHNCLPLPINLEPLECKNFITSMVQTIKKLNNFFTFVLLPS